MSEQYRSNQDKLAEQARLAEQDLEDSRLTQEAIDKEEGKRMRGLWLREQQYQARKTAFLRRSHGDE